MKKSQIFLAGIFSENPSLVVFLGMCPSLVASRSLNTAFGMGLAVIVVLLLSNIVISAIRNLVPNEVRIPVFIVVVAAITKVIEMLMHAFTPEIYKTLGVFIPLIVVNCIILGRAEAFASKNTVIDSILDALGMSFGFTLSMLLIAVIREFLGTGGLTLSNPFNASQVWFQFSLFKDYAAGILVHPVGAFLTFGTVAAVVNFIRDRFAQMKARQAAPAAKPAEKAV